MTLSWKCSWTAVFQKKRHGKWAAPYRRRFTASATKGVSMALSPCSTGMSFTDCRNSWAVICISCRCQSMKSWQVTPKELAELVEKNNASRIRLNERLSNQVYRYDRKQRRLSLATDTPDKRLDGNGTRHDRPDGKRQSR